MTGARRIANNLFHLFSGEAVSSGLAFIITIWLARKLSGEGFGQWAFAQSVVIYLVLLVDFGLSTFGVRELARKKRQPSRLVASILSIRIVLATVLFILFVCVIILLDISPQLELLFIGAALWLFIQALNPEFIFQGLELMAGVAVWRVFSHLFYLLALLVFVHTLNDLTKVPYLRFLGALFPAIGLLFNINRQIKWTNNLSFQTRRFKGYLATSGVMAGSLLVIKFYYTFDTLMLGVFDTAETVGWYNAAYKVVLLFIGIATLVQAAFAPAISRNKSDVETLNRLVQHYSVILGYLANLMFGTALLVSDEIIQLLYGSEYILSGPILGLLSISGFMVYIGTIYLSPLLYCGRHKNYFIAVSIGAIVNLVLNLLLIPRFGAKGAALATIASNSCIALYAASRYKQLADGLLIKGSVFHIAVFVVAGLLAHILPNLWWLKAGAFVVLINFVYFIIYREMLQNSIKQIFKHKAFSG